MYAWLYDYTEKVVEREEFDSSHDMTHFVNVYNYAKKIVENDYKDGTLIKNIGREDSIKILLNAAFCHDLIDGKYVDSEKAIKELRNVFLDNGYDKEYTEIIIYLIDNMSYSKRRKEGFQIKKEYELILNILCDADMLDAYRIERVIAYQSTKSDDVERNLKWVKTILVKRILRYKDDWLKTEYALSTSIPLHRSVEDYVNIYLKDVEMFDY